MKKYDSYDEAVAAKSDAHALTSYVLERVGQFSDGEDVQLDFLSHKQIGEFCKELGFAHNRNWATLDDSTIAPEGEEGVQIVPQKEASLVLGLLKQAIADKVLMPEHEGKKQPQILNDFLPKGQTFADEPCLGEIWEWQYALAVELEHGRMRNMNVTNNHPLLTGLVAMAHLAEDQLYYARLWVMETEGELFDLQTSGGTHAQIHETLEYLNQARSNLERRIAQKLQQA